MAAETKREEEALVRAALSGALDKMAPTKFTCVPFFSFALSLEGDNP